jgi:hypothetical protein
LTGLAFLDDRQQAAGVEADQVVYSVPAPALDSIWMATIVLLQPEAPSRQ